ncbi:MAG: TIGR00266 family protein [Bradymonadales bacterium]|nr:TIGR00266 family protein [Bradymonadales bacterium]
MQFELKHQPSFALLRVRLAPGESLTSEAGAMVTRSANVSMKTRLNAGTGAGFFKRILAFFVALFRKILGGETMFINTFTPSQTEGEVTLAPSMAGDIAHRHLENETLLLQAGAYLASSQGLNLKLKWGGLRAMFAKEGVVFLKVSGTGDLFFSAYGGIQAIPVNGSFIVDNGHMVAFDAGLKFKVRRAGGGFLGLFASGEGLVTEFSGTGTVYIQSRNLGSLIGWLLRLLPGV